MKADLLFIHEISRKRNLGMLFIKKDCSIQFHEWIKYLSMYVYISQDFRKKRFMLDEMFQRNASKFAVFLEGEILKLCILKVCQFLKNFTRTFHQA